MSRRIEGETTREQRLRNSLEAIIDVQEILGASRGFGADRRLKENQEIVEEIKEQRSNRLEAKAASNS